MREAINRRNQTDRRYSDIACRHTETAWRRINDPMESSHHCLIVCQGLPHSHEHNVRQVRGRSTNHPLFTRLMCAAYLVNDFGRRQITCQPHLTCGTERTAHPTPSLGRNAQSRPIAVTHEDRLHAGPVVEFPQVLKSLSTIGLKNSNLTHKRRKKCRRNDVMRALGHIRHQRGIAHVAFKVVTRKLVGAERRQPGLGNESLAFTSVKISKMTRGFSAPTRSKSHLRLRIRRCRAFGQLICWTYLTSLVLFYAHRNGLLSTCIA